MGERDQDDRTQSLRKSVMLRSIDLGENPPMSGGELAVFPDRESPEVLINRYFYTEHIHWDSEKARGMESAAGRSDPRWGRGAPGLHSRSSRSRPSLHRIRGDRAPGDRLNVKPPRYPAATRKRRRPDSPGRSDDKKRLGRWVSRDGACLARTGDPSLQFSCGVVPEGHE